MEQRQLNIISINLALVLMLALISGCALPMRKLTITHHPLDSVPSKKQGKILVTQFVDKRNKENLDLIGKRVSLQEGAKLEVVLTNFVSEALGAAGYSAVVQGQMSSNPTSVDYDAVISGEILEFWMDFNPGQVGHNVDIKINAVSPANQAVLWTKRIEAVQVNVNWVGARGKYSKVVDEALTKALNQAVHAFASDEFSMAIIKKKSSSN